MDKILFRYRVSTLIILIITALFMTACSAVEKAELAGMEAAAGAINADTWDDLLETSPKSTLLRSARCCPPG